MSDPQDVPAKGTALRTGTAAGRPRGFRGRALYNRRLQRTYEHWPLPARFDAWLFRRPEIVLGLLGSREPVVVDGRVLNRGLQAMLEVVNRLAALSLGGRSAAAGTFDAEAMRAQMRRVTGMVMPVRTDVHAVGRVITVPEGPEAGGGPAGDGADAPAGRRELAVRVYRRFGTGLAATAAVATTGDGAPGDGPPGGAGRLPPGIVYFHGGGWVTGDLDTHDACCRLLAAVSGCVVVAVDYRLAPEHPFPAAVDDAVDAYAWVHHHAGELGIDPERIGVMGDSAGGNLAAVVAQRTRPATTRRGARAARRDDAVPPPVAQVLVYPAVDARFDTPSFHALADGHLLTRGMMEFFRASYLPDPDTWTDPAASPLLADDLAGLAPALVVTAGFDPLRDEGAGYAAALAGAGVPVEHRCYDDQVHGFFGIGVVADSLALSVEVCDAAGRMLHGAVPAETTKERARR